MMATYRHNADDSNAVVIDNHAVLEIDNQISDDTIKPLGISIKTITDPPPTYLFLAFQGDDFLDVSSSMCSSVDIKFHRDICFSSKEEKRKKMRFV